MTVSGGLVVLSPHLDDAVLSVGGLIAGQVRSGRCVEVWTAFTAGPADPATVPRRLRPFADYRARIAEDDAALDLLGCGRRRLGLPERIWRTPPAGGLRAAFRTPEGPDGFARLAELTETAVEALSRPGAELLGPLGVGNHVDHVEVALAVLAAADRLGAWDRVGFYEDFYALGEAARHRHPVTVRHPWPRAAAPGWAAPVEGLVLRATPLIARGPSLDGYLPGLTGWPWRCAGHPLDGDLEGLKLAAVAAYRSQTPALGGIRRLSAILRRAHRMRGGELLWRVGSAGSAGSVRSAERAGAD
ncbi:MAG TPA: PIG-L family deacetylase [Kineosporiaceae bacterium]|nr:PIG-L family deacetylase [Kineosporiaceae bacterium]